MLKRTVRYLCANIDVDVFKVLLNNVKPSNKIAGFELPGITGWKFCDVMDLVSCVNSITPFEVVVKALSYHTKVKEVKLLKCDSNEFIRFLKHIKNEVEKVAQLQDSLKTEPKADLVNAGIDALDRFGITNIYYSISKNPLNWDDISEVSYGKMYTKLMIDKVNAEIQEKYNDILTEKSKRK